MGHCAPAIMQTLLEQNDIRNENMVLYSAGLAGGIAGSGTECGALISPLMFLSFSSGSLSDIPGRLDIYHQSTIICKRIHFRDEDNRAMDEEMNNFNCSINLSDELGLWFRNEFGFTFCYDIWRCDFSRTRDAESFIAGQCMKQCSGIGEKVARKVNSMV